MGERDPHIHPRGVLHRELVSLAGSQSRLSLRRTGIPVTMTLDVERAKTKKLAPDADLVRGVLARRIRGEFEEMPGLSLTSVQASKLFGISPDVCAAILADLIEEGILRLTSDGSYARRWHHI